MDVGEPLQVLVLLVQYALQAITDLDVMEDLRVHALTALFALMVNTTQRVLVLGPRRVHVAPAHHAKLAPI